MAGSAFFCKDVIGTFFKKHYCPDCQTRLKRKKVYKVVNSESEEAKNYDFSLLRFQRKGNVRFSWYEFECPSCQKQYTLEALRTLEG